MNYGDLFAQLLRSFGILSIGLYRFRDTAASQQQDLVPCAKRYVITNPPADFKLLSSDKVSPTAASYKLSLCLLVNTSLCLGYMAVNDR